MALTWLFPVFATLGQTSWTGASSTSWGTAANWTAGVPTASVDAIIGDANFTGTRQPALGAASVCKSLTIGTGTKVCKLTVGKALSVSGNIVIGTNGTISQTAGVTISVSGNWTNSGIYEFSNNNANVAFAGISQIIGGTSVTGFRKIVINASSTTTLATNFSVVNQLTVSGTLDPNQPATFAVSGAGKLVVNASGKILVRATTFAGNYALSGTKTLNAGSTVDYTASGDQTVANTLTYSTLRISGSGTKTLAGNLPVLVSSVATAGNIDVAAGTLDLSTFTANRGTSVAGGSLSVAAGATLKTGGTGTFPANYTTSSLASVSTVEYYGTNQTVSAQSYGHLTLSSSGAATKTMPATALTLAGNLTSRTNAGGASVSFTAGAAITVNGSVSLGAATTFTGSTFSHSVGGNWTNNGTFTGSTSTLTMNGVNAIMAGAGANNFFHLIIARSGITADANTSLNVAGDFSTTGAGTFTHNPGGTGAVTMSGAGKSISGSGITFSKLTISGSTGTGASFSGADDLTVSGSLTASAGTITLSGAGKKIAGAGTIAFSGLSVPGSVTTTNSFSLAGNLTVSGAFTATAGMTTFAGSTTLSGTANLFNTTLNGTLLRLSADSILGLAGTTTLTAGTFDVTNQRPNTVVFNSAGNQSVFPITYDNLKIGAGGTKTAAGNINVRGHLTIDAGAVFAGGASGYTNYVRKDWLNYGTFTAGNSTVEMVGPDSATMVGATTFNQLRVNKDTMSPVITLRTNQSVASLDMASGAMDTGTNTLTLTTTRTGSGVILGTITRTHAFAAGTAYAFESPNNTVSFSSLGTVSSVTVRVTPGPVTGFPFGASVNRLYTVSLSSSGAYVSTLRLHYEDSELNGNAESTLQLWRNSGSWASSGATANNTTSNWVEQSTLTTLAGDWTLSFDNGVARWNGSVSTAWENAANWTVSQGIPTLPPSTNDIANLGTTNVTFQPTISSAVAVKSISFGSAQALTLTLGAGGSLQTIGNVAGVWTNNVTHTINVGAQTLTVGGDLALSDGTSGHAINLSVSSGTVNVTAALIESGGANLTFSGAGVLNLGGNFDYTSGTFSPGTSTVNYNGSGAQTVGGVTYHQLNFLKSAGTATLPAAAAVNGHLTLTNGGTFRLGANLTVAGHVTVRTNTTLHLGGADLSVGGDWVGEGTLNISIGGAVVLTGRGAQAVGATTFHHFNINKPSGTATLAGNISVTAGAGIFSGNLDVAGFAINPGGAGALISLAAGTSLRTAGSFPTNFVTVSLNPASTVEYYGSANQSVAAMTYGHLVLTNGGSNPKTFVGPVVAAGNILIGTNATLAASSYSLSLLGNWTNNGVFTPGTGTVILNGTNKTVAGNTIFNNMTVGGSYTVANGNINITGNATILGTYAAGSGTNTIDGDLFNSGAMSSTGTTTFTGTRVQTIQLLTAISSVSSGVVNFNGTVPPVLNTTTSPQFANLNINNLGGVTASVGWTVFTGFKVAAGAAFNGSVFTHTFYGTVTNDGTMTSSGTLNFIPLASRTLVLGTGFSSVGLVAFSGANQITISSGALSLGSVLVANTHAAGITPVSNWTLAGDLQIGSGAIFHSGTGLTHMLAGSLANNGTLNGGTSLFVFNGATEINGIGSTLLNNVLITGGLTNFAAISVTGNFTNNGSFEALAVDVIFSGSSPSLIAGATTPTSMDSLVIAKSSATATLGVNVSGLTALNISGGTLDTATFSVSEDPMAFGALTVAAGGTLKLGGANAFPTFSSGVILDAASTVEFAGTGAQTITAQNYGHLTSSSSGARTLAASGTVGIAGTFTPGANSYTIPGSTIDFNGASAQPIAAFNYNHLTSSSSGARTLASSGTIGVLGTFTPGANTFTVTGSTMNFNGAAQTIPAFTYGNLPTSGSGAKTLGGNVTVGSMFTLGAGGLADGGFVATVAGDINNNVTHSGAGKILLAGGTTNHVLTGAGAFENLELSDTNSAVLNATNLVINGTLTLATGTIVTGTNRVIVATAGTVSRTNGHVAGSLQKSMTSTLTNRVFEIGDASIYAPVTVILTNVTVAGTLTASTTAGDHPAITNSGLSATRSVNRYWSLTNSGITFNNSSAVFQFAASDIDAGADPSTFLVAKRTGGTWTLPTVGTKTSTNIQTLGLTSFGDFQVGQSTNLPVITTQPQSQSVTVGQNVTFTATAEGAATLAYQWRFNGTNLSGATSTNLVITNVQSSHAGSYTIVVTNFNGTETSSVALLTVLRASTTNVLASSTNPARTGSNVTFTATLSVLAPGSGSLNGTVQFRADGTALGSPAALVNGVASVSTTTLAHGARTITAEFAGDSNFLGSTSSLSQVINTPPVAGNDTITRYPNGAVRVPLATLLTNDSDADLDTLTPSISSTSLFGGTITVSGSYVVYTPAPGFTNADSFTYSVADGFGGSAVATVAVNLVNNTAQSQNSVITFLGGGSFRLTFWGIPGRAYTVQATTNIVTPSWFSLTNLTAATNGLYETIDTPPTNTPSRFYRSVYP